MATIVLAILASLAQCQQYSFLFIQVDDMSRLISHLNIKGAYNVPTPNLDGLYRRGVTFTNAQVCAPACKPSRTCLLFSLSPKVTNVRANTDEWVGNPAFFGKENLISYLKRAGYRTVNHGRLFHNRENGKNFFDKFVGGGAPKSSANISSKELFDKEFRTVTTPLTKTKDWAQTTNVINDMMADEKANRPGFYALGYTTCHIIIDIPEEVMQLIPKNAQAPPSFPEDDGFNGSDTGKSAAARGLYYVNRPALGQAFVRHHYGCIKTVDLAVKRVLDFVYNSKREYVVFFTSDHGYHLLDKERIRKFTLYPQVTQVPFIAYGGPFKGGKRIDEPITLGDVYPTIVDLIGQVPKHKLVGKSLVPLLGGDTRDDVVSYSNGPSKAVITKKWHLIVRANGSVLLYDRIGDPWAIKNVAKSNPFVVDQLRKREWV